MGLVVSQLPEGTRGSISVLQGQMDNGTAEGAGMGLRQEATPGLWRGESLPRAGAIGEGTVLDCL